MSGRIIKAKFIRCNLVFNISTDKTVPVRLCKIDGSISIEPSIFAFKDGVAEVGFNLASGFSGKVVPGGNWTLDGEFEADFEAVEADFSGSGTKYRVNVYCEAGRININIDYIKAPISVKNLVADFGLNLAYYAGRLLTHRANRVIFTSESRSEPSGNMEFVLKKAAEFNFNAKKIIYSFKNGGSLMFYLKTSFMLGGCDTVVTDDYMPLLYHLRFPSNVRIIQLWHACGAYKTVGYSRAGLKGAPRIDGNSHRCYTHAVVSSNALRPFYAEAFGINVEKVYATGVPRTDVFFNSDYARLKRAEFFDAYSRFKGKRIILFAPTFRGNGKHSAHYPADKIDFSALAEYCRQNNSAVIFKMHPFVKDFTVPNEFADVFANLHMHREINDLLFAADVLITDYSSVIYEAALLNIKMLFYVFDLDEYAKSRDFYEPFERYAAGKIVNSFDELISALKAEDFESEKSADFRKRNMDMCDGNASQRVADMIFHDDI